MSVTFATAFHAKLFFNDIEIASCLIHSIVFRFQE